MLSFFCGWLSEHSGLLRDQLTCDGDNTRLYRRCTCDIMGILWIRHRFGMSSDASLWRRFLRMRGRTTRVTVSQRPVLALIWILALPSRWRLTVRTETMRPQPHSQRTFGMMESPSSTGTEIRVSYMYQVDARN